MLDEVHDFSVQPGLKPIHDVAVAVAVAVLVGVLVGVLLAVAVAVPVGVAVAVPVAVGVSVLVGVPVAVAGVPLAVSVPVAMGVPLPVGVLVPVGSVLVAVGVSETARGTILTVSVLLVRATLPLVTASLFLALVLAEFESAAEATEAVAVKLACASVGSTPDIRTGGREAPAATGYGPE